MTGTEVMEILLYMLGVVTLILGYPLAALPFVLASLAILLVERPQW